MSGPSHGSTASASASAGAGAGASAAGVEQSRHAFIAVREEIAKAVVGQDAVVSGVVVALLADGHVLLEGVPGVAKTLLVRVTGGGACRSTRNACSSRPT